MSAVGLDITDQRVRFLELEEGAGGYVVKRYGEAAIPPGVIIGGTIKRSLEFAAILQGLKRKHGFEFVRVSLPEERAYIVHMDIPRVEEAGVHDAIAFQLEEYVPLKPDQAIFDYAVLGDDGKSEKMRLLVAVMPEEDVSGYTTVLSEVGMKPVMLEIEGQAVAHALVEKGDSRLHMIVDIGRMRTGVSVVKDDIVRFTSTVDMGSDMLTQSIVQTMNVSEEEAFRLKNEHTLGEHADELGKSIESFLKRLSGEVEKMYEYWHTYHSDKPSEGPIEEIILSGGGANLPGLTQYLSSELRIPVSLGNPWRNVNSYDRYIPTISAKEALGYATVIGLALPHEE
ncbi:MAG: type IV pilus assembly protein PilM [Candidatus Yonathbacteria bacterium]|nr:type IV pilus assembly protein PilM [Candidatus Yonathbacteria bacterium]